jgi:hypothetical protein
LECTIVNQCFIIIIQNDWIVLVTHLFNGYKKFV